MVWSTRIDLMRHGEPEGGQLYRGQIDHPLSELGWQQMRETMPVDKPWQQIVTSPLTRCAGFAEELARETGLPLAYEPGWMEIAFGDWEGQTATLLRQRDQQAFDAFCADPVNHTPPGAEPLEAFRQRILEEWQALLSQYKERRVLVITHAGCIRVIVAHILDIPLGEIGRIEVPYAGLSRIDINGHPAQSKAHLTFHAGQI